ncbi:MAG: hypothetical protein ACE15C_20420, partial [Phycisphaerae bacterium]
EEGGRGRGEDRKIARGDDGRTGGREEDQAPTPAFLPSSSPPFLPSPSARLVRPLAETDWPVIAALDRPAFGADRLALLKHLAVEGPALVAVLPSSPPPVIPSSRPPFLPPPPPPVSPSPPLTAFGLARPGHEAWQLGPVVARDADSARAIVEALLAAMPAGEVYWDLLPRNTAAAELARSMGFTLSRRLTRMCLGAYHPAAGPPPCASIYAAGGFELG